MKRKKILIILLIIFTGINCRPSSKSDEEAKISFEELGAFISAGEVPIQSKLYHLTLTKAYKDYKKQIDMAWNSFQAKNLKEIERWRFTNVPAYTNTMFYPFSGPDIMNALAFYPDSEKYIMLGLEPPGKIPNADNLSDEEILTELEDLKVSLRSVLQWNFFITSEMKEVIGKKKFSGITGVIMLLLEKYGYFVRNIKYMWINTDGEAVYSSRDLDPETYINGCEITFSRKNTQEIKRINFIQLDVNDNSLQKYTNFMRFIKKQERFSTLIKAASYLMHEGSHAFSIIRHLTLSRSDIIIEDDTGIPLRFFPDQDWKLIFYGSYLKPIELFEDNFQQDLYNRVLRYSYGRLPFCYGYYLSAEKSHLLMAIRRK